MFKKYTIVGIFNRFNFNSFGKNLSSQIYRIKKFTFSEGITIENSFNYNTKSFYEPITIKNIKDNWGARKSRIKLGRGPGSGKGKTSGRGHKGYKARVGNISRHYEGGSTPITRRLPKHGFRNKGDNFNYINLNKLAYFVNKGRIDASKPITMRELCWSGAITNIRQGVKLLSRGSEDIKDLPALHLELSSASKRAIDEIKSNGGSVTIVHKTTTTLRAMIKPWKFIRAPLDPVPKFKKVKKLMNLESKGAA